MALTPPRSQEGRSCPICYRPGNEEGAGTCLPTAAALGRLRHGVLLMRGRSRFFIPAGDWHGVLRR
jgi:hypothetical protein